MGKVCQMNVYFVQAGELFKIGKAANVEDRIATLQTGCPIRMKLLGVLRCRSDLHAMSVEKQLHRSFRRVLAHGEWFQLGDQERLMIQRCVEIGTLSIQEATWAVRAALR